jgi:hypothetical protein
MLIFLSGVVARVGTLEARCNVNVVEIFRVGRELEALVWLARDRERVRGLRFQRQDCSENCKENCVSPKRLTIIVHDLTHLSRNTARWFRFDRRIARQSRTATV